MTCRTAIYLVYRVYELCSLFILVQLAYEIEYGVVIFTNHVSEAQ